MEEGVIVHRDYNVIAKHKHEFITLSEKDALVACCALRKHSSCTELYAFAVAKEHWGKGHGTTLLQKSEEHVEGTLIALSKYQGAWFLSHGFTELTSLELPDEIMYNTKRAPHIYSKC